MLLKMEQTAEDIGHAAGFLISKDAKNITGQSLNVDGGMVMQLGVSWSLILKKGDKETMEIPKEKLLEIERKGLMMIRSVWHAVLLKRGESFIIEKE